MAELSRYDYGEERAMISAEGKRTINIDLYNWLIEPTCDLEGIYECLWGIQRTYLENTIDEGLQGEEYKRFLAAFHFLRKSIEREYKVLDKLLDDGIDVEV